ncbi:IS1 transposase [Bacteroidales bacterium Barb7]|nr:IS1 transposase [Bacteroidales bacterium Barb7]
MNGYALSDFKRKCCSWKQKKWKQLKWMKCTAMSIKKNYCWIWIAVDRLGKRFIDFIAGDRSTETGKKLWEKINGFEMNVTATDYRKSYDSFIPEEKHVRTKAGTFTVEGYNSLFRHFLARMRRKSKCYSKSKEMLELSFLLLMKYRNKELSIFS